MRRLMTNFIGSTGLQTAMNQSSWDCSAHDHCHGHQHQQLESTVKGKHLRQCQLVTVVGGVTNVLLCGTKISIGASGGCVALVADGFHAFVDVFSDFVSYVALTLSAKQLPRCRFPFGVGRIETAGAVIVAFSLLFGGLALLFHSLNGCSQELFLLFNRFFVVCDPINNLQNNQNSGGTHYEFHNNGTHDGVSVHSRHSQSHSHSLFQMTEVDDMGRVTILWAMVVVSVVSILWKEVLFCWTRRVGELAGSRVVVANAYHHRADAWSGAVALFGVIGHCVGLPLLDGLAGLCVSLGICKVGYSLLRSSVLEFFDYQNAKEVADVRRELQQYDKYRSINVFLIRHGYSYALHVTLIVEGDTPASIVVSAANELTAFAKRSVPVTDTYITLCLCNKQEETSLRVALKMVETFHGLQPIVCDWENKELIIYHTLPNECIEDIRCVAFAFGLQIVFANAKCETDENSNNNNNNNNNDTNNDNDNESHK